MTTQQRRTLADYAMTEHKLSERSACQLLGISRSVYRYQSQPKETDVLIADWLRDPLSRSQSRDLLEILDDRYGRSATMVVTQVPVTDWHARLPDPTLSDAILDRLIHNAYRLELQGESMRKVHSPLSSDHK